MRHGRSDRSIAPRYPGTAIGKRSPDWGLPSLYLPVPVINWRSTSGGQVYHRSKWNARLALCAYGGNGLTIGTQTAEVSFKAPRGSLDLHYR